jgi:hypothetical protein
MKMVRTQRTSPQWNSLPAPAGALGATVAVTDSANGRLLIGTRGGLWAVGP